MPQVVAVLFLCRSCRVNSLGFREIIHRASAHHGNRDLVTGVTMPVQTISDSEVAFLSKDVPAFGYRSYVVIPGQPTAPRIVAAPSPSLETNAYKLTVRATDGAFTSLLDKDLNQELVDSSADKAANSLLRWIPTEILPAAWPDVRITKETGPVFSRLTVRRPGTLWPETQVTLTEGVSKIRIQNTSDRDKMPFVASNQAGEYYSFHFPARSKASRLFGWKTASAFTKFPKTVSPECAPTRPLRSTP